MQRYEGKVEPIINELEEMETGGIEIEQSLINGQDLVSKACSHSQSGTWGPS